MTSTLKLSAAALTAVLSLAGAARAEGVKITYDVNAPQAARAQVLQAARSVCAEATDQDIRGEYGSFSDCVVNTTHDALQKMRAQPAARIVAQTAQR